MKNFKIFIFFAIFTLIISCTGDKPSPVSLDIIPAPKQVDRTKGSFTFDDKTAIIINSDLEDVMMVAEGLSERIAVFTRKKAAIENEKGKAHGNSIVLKLDNSIYNDVGREGYFLSVQPSIIEIRAYKPAGLFFGLQTLYQLMPSAFFKEESNEAKNKAALVVPCVEIMDKPSFAWRGMHLDVSRHFFDKAFIKKYIDLIAFHKMNIFHWHLTDDNGWRIEIDRYPLLTEVSAWRADREGIPWTECEPQRPGEPATYGGYYTKEEIREIVEYARQRFVTIVPEIEMPGHSSEIFAAYPEFSCSGKRITVQTGSYWPNTDILCAGKDETFTFLENVLDEVVALFPGEYIHIGGDEADKTAWKSCPDCRSRMSKENLGGVDELQSYFVKRIEKYLASKNKKMIGWDEIREGGLAPDATVMSWRGFEGGIEAAQQGHQVVMCPTSHCYFDYYQANPDFQPEAIGGLTTLKKVYSFRPIPSELTGNSRKLILGGQGNLWTEYIDSPSRAEYMALPRMSALAEVLWTPEENLNWDDFTNRLRTQFERFQQLGVNYSQGSAKVEVEALFNQVDKPYSLKLTTEAPDKEIHYSLSGRDPDINSFIYSRPLPIDYDVTLKAIAFDQGKPLEKPAEFKITYHKAIGLDINYRELFSERYPGNGPHALNDGIRGSLNYNDGYWQGFNGKNADIVIDLGEDGRLSSVTATFLLDQNKWIFIPEIVNYYLSIDGVNFQKLAGITHTIDLNTLAPLTNDFTAKLNKPIKIRYLRVEAVNIGDCPDWHAGKGQKAWLFLDEIIVN